MLRTLDLIASMVGILLTAPLLLVLYIICLFDTGSPIFKQERVGRNLKPFTLIKFRTMALGTTSVATHLVNASSITRFGSFLRKTKLDELPQLYNVIRGDMSLVGPRPGLYNQEALTSARQAYDVYSVRPGITGLAQVNAIDMSTPELLAKTDKEMIDKLNLANYLTYICQTIMGCGRGDRV